MKTALLVLVHGSPNSSANDEMYRVLNILRDRHIYPIVDVGFLECNEPDIPAAIRNCIRQGVERVIAVPYFLHTGNHVADDLPTLLEDAAEAYPNVEFLLSDFLGRSSRITEILVDRAKTAGDAIAPPEFDRKA